MSCAIYCVVVGICRLNGSNVIVARYFTLMFISELIGCLRFESSYMFQTIRGGTKPINSIQMMK